MTPPAAAPVRVRTPSRAAPPRRRSGPVHRPAARGAAATAPAVVVLPLPLRAAGAVRGISDLPLLDRLVRGRLWIAFIAVALFGIVFLQVSLLGLNARISRDVASIERLERDNAVLRADVARLGGPQRVGATALRLGMTAPVAGAVAFVDAGVDPARAAARMTAPDALRWQEGLAADLQKAGVVTPPAEAQGAAAPGAAEAQGAVVAGTPPASATTAPVTTATAPATTAPATAATAATTPARAAATPAAAATTATATTTAAAATGGATPETP